MKTAAVRISLRQTHHRCICPGFLDLSLCPTHQLRKDEACQVTRQRVCVSVCVYVRVCMCICLGVCVYICVSRGCEYVSTSGNLWARVGKAPAFLTLTPLAGARIL